MDYLTWTPFSFMVGTRQFVSSQQNDKNLNNVGFACLAIFGTVVVVVGIVNSKQLHV